MESMRKSLGLLAREVWEKVCRRMTRLYDNERVKRAAGLGSMSHHQPYLEFTRYVEGKGI